MPAPALSELLGASLDAPLMRRALTHRSSGARHNEILEFVGDAALDLLIADALCARFPQLDEGGLTRLRAHLVRGSTLAALAREAGLPALLRLGKGEPGGAGASDSILSGALEAVVGALYRDAGLEAARALVQALFAERLAKLPSPDEVLDPKTRLQERLQAAGHAPPTYSAQPVGDAQTPAFQAVCNIPPFGLAARGRGATRRGAEQRAAAAALAKLPSGA